MDAQEMAELADTPEYEAEIERLTAAHNAALVEAFVAGAVWAMDGLPITGTEDAARIAAATIWPTNPA